MKLLICVLACFCVLHVNGQPKWLSRFMSFVCQSSQCRNNPFYKDSATKPGNRLSWSESSSNHGKATNVDSNVRFVTTGITNSRGLSLTGSSRRVNNAVLSARVKRQSRQPDTEKKDLVILMDESGSVGENLFEKVKRMAAAIIRMLCNDMPVHPQYTRVAVVSFDSQIHIHRHLFSLHNFLQNYDGNAIADWISNISYSRATQGSTCLIDALNYVADTELSRTNGGRRGEPNLEQAIILIFDGCDNCRNNSREEMIGITRKFISANISVFIIGIGLNKQCQSEINLLSQDRKCFEFFNLTTDDEMNEFLQAMENPPPGICFDSFELANKQCVTNLGG